MQLKGVDAVAATKLISQHIDFVTCFQCCKYYIAPETAACGHTLCHLCWKGQRTCPSCGESINKKSLTLNMTMKIITEHIRDLVEPFEMLTGLKMEELGLEVQELNKNSEGNIPKNVKEWLSSSQNHFSMPPNSETQKSLPDYVSPVKLSDSKILIHAEPNKIQSPPRIAHVAPPQDDWDTIKPANDTEDIFGKDKHNVVGPMDLEPFYIDDDTEYTTNKPRRSSRKKDTSLNISSKRTIADKNSSNNSDSNKKTDDKVKQNMSTHVKKMRKEFRKLTKNNKNKLNVSIEMCKRTQSVKSKHLQLQTIEKDKLINQTVAPSYVIEENTPDIEMEKNERPYENIVVSNHSKNQTLRDDENIMTTNKVGTSSGDTNSRNSKTLDLVTEKVTAKKQIEEVIANNCNLEKNPVVCDGNDPKNNSQARNVPFVKKSNFQNVTNKSHTIFVENQEPNQESSNKNDEDIHITIRIGTVVTNITINKKRDVKLKVNSDREVQASLGNHVILEKNQNDGNTSKTVKSQVVTNPSSLKNNATHSTASQACNTKHNEKSISTAKKNTASAETVTAQYEISESVEKELSNLMDYEDLPEQLKQTTPRVEDRNKMSEPACENQISQKAQMQYKDKLSHTESISQIPATKSRYNTSKIKNTESLAFEKEIPTKKSTPTVLVENSEDNIIEKELGYLDEVDIFNSGSVKECNVKSLKHIKGTPSEIFAPTNKTRLRTQRDKRNRDVTEEEDSAVKRQKLDSEDVINNSEVIPETDPNKLMDINSEAITYDIVMSQVFANIDADIRETQASKTVIDLDKEKIAKSKQITQTGNKNEELKAKLKKNDSAFQKYSENMFSTIGNIENDQVAGPETQRNIENLLTPGMCRDLGATNQTRDDDVHFSTPRLDDDSDKSVVEETPQKDKSKTSSKAESGNKTVIPNRKLQLKPKNDTIHVKEKANDLDEIINLTDSVMTEKGNESNGAIKPRNTLETPLTINRFLDDIKHKSTPFARKSLNFAQNKGTDEDDDVTLCPSANIIANTTQEKAIMSEAFANVNSPVRRPLSAMNTVAQTSTNFCIAGSCLTNSEIVNVKILCFKRKWTFVDKFKPELTHLVVGVDEEKKAQRSVKYMCALAASKWIVSYSWVAKCLETNNLVNEEPYEALDSTGDPGPRNSRLAQQKIFHGIKFYCMPPFSVLDVDTLKTMLESAGGCVVDEASAVKVKDESPSLLLAEPANTEEDRFMYMAMELSVVPINYEWVLNCLGSYTLCSIHDLLLCPASLLPAPTKRWPLELMCIDD